MNDQAEVPRSHNFSALPLDEQARIAINEAIRPAKTRWSELEASFNKAPAEIADEETAGKVTTLIGQLQACLARVDHAHEGAKFPFLEAGRLVDGVANGLREKVGDAKSELEARLTKYQTAKAARVEADRLAEQQSYDADPEPSWVKPETLIRRHAAIRSDEGASAHLRSDFDVEITDAKKIPKRILERPKVLAAIAAEVKAEIKRDAKQRTAIKGIAVHDKKRSQVRR